MARTQNVDENSIRHPSTGQTAPLARAIVVFEDRQEQSLIRLLRPGFRHCFCLIGGDLAWTVCDPLLTRIELVSLLGFDETDLACHYTRSGRTILVGNVSGSRTRHTRCLRPMTCVEVLKRVLNIDAPHVFTPFQLYRSLLERRAPDERFRHHLINP